MFRKSIFMLMLFVLPVLVVAQNTGKIAGRVTDAATGDGIPGATVQLVNTNRGAITDASGNFYIIGVPVATYTLRASFVGYQSEEQTGIRVSTGYTSEVNFKLKEAISGGNIVTVVGEPPIIQKDAVGATKIISGADIQNLPVRGVNGALSIQAGVSSQDRGGSINARGGRSGEIVYFVDGVRTGDLVVPQAAIQEQEMLVGNISARYGDAMSGVVNITTRSGNPEFFGTLEGVTSQYLDPFGYNLAEGSIGGPIIKNKVNFFISGQYTKQKDTNPAWKGYYAVPEDIANQWELHPQVMTVIQKDGTTAYVDIPTDIPLGSKMKMSGTAVDQTGGKVIFIDPAGKEYAIDLGGADNHLKINNGVVETWKKGEVFPIDQYEYLQASRDNFARQNVQGNLTFNLSKDMRLRVGGAVNRSTSGGTGTSVASYNRFTKGDNFTNRGFATWTHYLSKNTFYQLQADFEDYGGVSYDPKFGKDLNNFIFYGDMDNAANEIGARYRSLLTQSGVPTLLYPGGYTSVQDGSGLSGTINGFYSQPSTFFAGYSKNHGQTLHFSGEATTQIGLHQIQFGAEYEQRTNRSWSIGNAAGFARLYDDGKIEDASSGRKITSYSDLTFADLDRNVGGYYGYNMNGTAEVDDESITGLLSKDLAKANVAPYRPLFYGGFIQDKIEYKDLVVNMGVRMDVFDNNNALVPMDPYALLEIFRAGSYTGTGYAKPSNIGDDYGVLFSDGDPKKGVVGFRDIEGNFYNAQGQSIKYSELPSGAAHKEVYATFEENFNEKVFKAYEPAVNIMPRIGLSFPVTDKALFFASYGVTAQRPSGNYQSLYSIYRFARDNSGSWASNPDLKPPRTIEYTIGFRERLGQKIAFTLTGFYRQQKDQIAQRKLIFTYPWSVNGINKNVDFASIKGIETQLDIRRTNGVAVSANYTLQYAEGTGSDPSTFGNISWLGGADPYYPNFLSRMNFDNRHAANVSVDYRLGKGEGPELFGGNPFQNFGINLLFTFRSGRPYTSRTRAYDAISPGPEVAGFLTGSINNVERPSTTRFDLKVDRRFSFGKKTALTAYVEIQNLLNQENIVGVYAATGLADNDGYLSQFDGIAKYPEGTIRRDQYNLFVNNARGNYGIPRTIRGGLRFTF
jgi:hypothetical protein